MGGGILGLRSMLEMNKVLKGKWVWRFMKERDGMILRGVFLGVGETAW